MNFLDPDRRHANNKDDKDYDDYLKRQCSDFARDLSNIEKLSRDKKSELVSRCANLHDILLRKDFRRNRRMGLAA